ncbi:MAG TPA: hypothetical protein VLH56_13670, partial [Dissulfurispiraceae bacterium]|nr:hypothetical protein [Dissulfurispiraceae bacterium]
LDAKCTAKNDSLRGSRIEKLGSIHVRTSPEIDPAEPQRDFFSSLIGRNHHERQKTDVFRHGTVFIRPGQKGRANEHGGNKGSEKGIDNVQFHEGPDAVAQNQQAP